MHELLIAHQSALQLHDLSRYAAEVGLDVERFWDDLRARTHTPRVAEDVESADMSGVTGTPSFFVNARRHEGGYDITTLSRLVREAVQAHHDQACGPLNPAPVCGVAEHWDGGLQCQERSGTTPQNGAGSMATDTAASPRPPMIWVSSPRNECPTTPDSFSSLWITSQKDPRLVEAAAGEPCLVTGPRITVVSDSWCWGSARPRSTAARVGRATDVADLDEEDGVQRGTDGGLARIAW